MILNFFDDNFPWSWNKLEFFFYGEIAGLSPKNGFGENLGPGFSKITIGPGVV